MTARKVVGPAGSIGQVQLNGGGVFSGSNGLWINSTTEQLQVSGGIKLGNSLNLDNKCVQSASHIHWIPVVDTSTVDYGAGTLYFDDDDQTLSMMTDVSGTVLQIGQEHYIKFVNKTGDTLSNGTVMTLSGALGNRPMAWKTDISDINLIRTDGVVTNTVLPNEEGYITIAGIVRDIDTSAWEPGESLYVSSTPGVLTNVEPSNGDFWWKVGITLNSTNNGSILVQRGGGPTSIENLHDVNIGTPTSGNILVGDGSYWVGSNLETEVQVIHSKYSGSTFLTNLLKEPTGFQNRTGSQLSFVSGTRTFTISPVASDYDFYIKGTRYVKTGSSSVVWSDTEGQHYFYFDTIGTLNTTTNVSDWISVLKGDGTLVASLYWNAVNNKSIVCFEERHGFMDPNVHAELHLAFGAQWISGGALSNIVADGDGSSAAHASFAVGTVRMMDEDIDLTFSDGSPQTLYPTASIPIYYMSGTNAVWRKKDSDTYPLIYNGIISDYTGASGRAPYNQNTGTEWKLTEVSQNGFFLVHYYVTNDVTEPVIGIQGQSSYLNLTDARNGAEDELTNLSGVLRLLANENTPLGTVIYQTSTGYTNVPKARIRTTLEGGSYIDFRGNEFRGASSVAGVTDHGQLSGLSDNDHPQYYHVSGTNNIAANLNVNGYQTTLTGSGNTSSTWSLRCSDNGSQGIIFIVRDDGFILMPTVPSGATQEAAGAVTGSIWRTSGHATLPDGVLMIGI